MTVLMVSGFGRCGSSLMMQMLNAGGIPTTGPYPSFEDEHTNIAAFDLTWFECQQGRAVKVIDPHHVRGLGMIRRIAIWIDRDPRQQAKSHAKFLKATLGADVNRATRKRVANSFRAERPRALCAASDEPAGIFVTSFEDLIEKPQAVMHRMAVWLGGFGFTLLPELAAGAVIPRSTDCLPYLLEVQQIANAPTLETRR